jgi:hypothetical protein
MNVDHRAVEGRTIGALYVGKVRRLHMRFGVWHKRNPGLFCLS